MKNWRKLDNFFILEIDEFLLDHSINEAILKFGVSKSTIKRRCKNFTIRKKFVPKSQVESEILEYLKTHSVKETIEKYKFSKKIIGQVLRSSNFNSKERVESIRESTFIKKYGQKYPSLIEDFRKKAKINLLEKGVNSGAQTRIPREELDLCRSKELMKDYILSFDKNDRQINKLSKNLIYSRQSLGRYISKLGLSSLLTKAVSHGSSAPEKEIADTLENWGLSLIRNSRKIIPPLELDMYFPEYSLAIEFDGSYWHNYGLFPKKEIYDKRKELLCKESKIKLVRINEKEYKENKNLIFIKLFKLFGLSDKFSLVLENSIVNSDSQNDFYDVEVDSPNHNYLTEIGVVHNSEEFHQALERSGIPVYRESIDRVTNGINQPYSVLRNVIYDERIDLLDDEDQTNELVSLEKYESGKIDKPLGGEDDSAQCLAGAVYLASKAKDEILASGAVLLKQLDSSQSFDQIKADPDQIVDKELEKHFSIYSPEAIVVNQTAGMRDEWDKFFGKDKKEEKKKEFNITSCWG